MGKEELSCRVTDALLPALSLSRPCDQHKMTKSLFNGPNRSYECGFPFLGVRESFICHHIGKRL